MCNYPEPGPFLRQRAIHAAERCNRSRTGTVETAIPTERLGYRTSSVIHTDCCTPAETMDTVSGREPPDFSDSAENDRNNHLQCPHRAWANERSPEQ